MVEIPTDAARYPDKPGLISGVQALEVAFGSRVRERQQKDGAVAGYGAEDGRLCRSISEVI